MFIFYQVGFSVEYARVLLGKSVCTLVSGTYIEFEESKSGIRCPVLKLDFSNNGTSLDFDSQYDILFYHVIQGQ